MHGKYQPGYFETYPVTNVTEVNGYMSKKKNGVWSFTNTVDEGAKLFKTRQGAVNQMCNLQTSHFWGEVVEVNIPDEVLPTETTEVESV